MTKIKFISAASLALLLMTGCSTNQSSFDPSNTAVEVVGEVTKGVAEAAKAMLANEKKRTHDDKNHAAITKLVSGHLADIEEAAAKAASGSVESVGHSLRFLYLSCKACHKVYQTEKRLRP